MKKFSDNPIDLDLKNNSVINVESDDEANSDSEIESVADDDIEEEVRP